MSYTAGQRIGDYRLEERLGGGGFSAVWKARTDDGEEPVALKLPTDDEAIALLRQEADILRELDHPHVIGLIEPLDTSDDIPHLVLELASGDTLRDRLQRGPLPLAEARDLFAGIVAGLAHAHEKGIVHRDLKPENVLLTPDGRPLLTDFGLADTLKGPDALALSGQFETQVRGTVAYMSPEQRRGQKGELRSDVYTLGLILFELVTGHLPEPGDSLEKSSPEAPRFFGRVFQGCFCRYDDRFASAMDVQRALPDLEADEPEPKAETDADADRKEASAPVFDTTFTPAKYSDSHTLKFTAGKGLSDEENMARYKEKSEKYNRGSLRALGIALLFYVPILALVLLFAYLAGANKDETFGAVAIVSLIFLGIAGPFVAFHLINTPKCPNCGNLVGQHPICSRCRRRLW